MSSSHFVESLGSTVGSSIGNEVSERGTVESRDALDRRDPGLGHVLKSIRDLLTSLFSNRERESLITELQKMEQELAALRADLDSGKLSREKWLKTRASYHKLRYDLRGKRHEIAQKS